MVNPEPIPTATRSDPATCTSVAMAAAFTLEPRQFPISLGRTRGSLR